jgi:hypothetical protein
MSKTILLERHTGGSRYAVVENGLHSWFGGYCAILRGPDSLHKGRANDDLQNKGFRALDNVAQSAICSQ